MKDLNNLSHLLDNQLLENFSFVIQREREAIIDVIVHLAEISKRKLYAREAYPSLFAYVTGKYHYSGGAAYRRIQAAKLYQRFPEILNLLQEGKLNLMAISLIEPHVTAENGKMLIDKVIGKSKNEVENILSELSLKKEQSKDVIRRLPIRAPRGDTSSLILSGPDMSQDQGTVQGVSTGGNEEKDVSNAISTGENKTEEKEQVVRRVKIEFVADESLVEMIERAKQVLHHKFPKARLEEIFSQALEDMLEKRDMERKIARKTKRQKNFHPEKKKSEQSKIQTRYIPEMIRKEVWQRDEGQCTYRSSDGKRCFEKGGIELDHVKPWGIGGDSSLENLRLLCRSHNQWRSWKPFEDKKTNLQPPR